MIFLGDVAHPFTAPPTWFASSAPWRPQAISINLEGAFSSDLSLLKRRKLFNHPSVIDQLVATNVSIANLANNHIMDIEHGLGETLRVLAKHGIQGVGAGMDRKTAAVPAVLMEEGREFRILSFGWSVIGCKPAGQRRPGVNSLEPSRLLREVEHQRRAHANACIAIQLHWNFEMELYPHPAHRQLAMAAIDAGADLVIGHHPHRVGGAEMHAGKPIIYSLGNWWLPQHVFLDGRAGYNDESLLQLAVEWRPGSEPTAHWFTYERGTHSLVYVSSEPVLKSAQLRMRTPFMGMTHSEYQKWFLEHRVKKNFLPAFRDYEAQAENMAKEQYIHLRHLGIVALERSGLRRKRAA